MMNTVTALGAAFLLTLAMVAIPVQAQEVPPTFNEEHVGRFSTYLRGDEMADVRQAYATRIQQMRNKTCEEEPRLSLEIERGNRYHFDEEKPSLEFAEGLSRPANAVWYEGYRIRMCNIRDMVRVRAVIAAGNAPTLQWQPPGDTRLSLEEINFVWRTISNSRTRLVGVCSTRGLSPERTLINIRQAGGAGIWLGLASETEWDELWTLRACDRDSPIELRFLRNAETGRIENISQAVLSHNYGGSNFYTSPHRSRDPEAEERQRRRMEDRDPYRRPRD